MKCTVLILFGFLAFGTCQDNGGTKSELTSEGPEVTLRISWNAETCPKARYRASLCSNDDSKVCQESEKMMKTHWEFKSSEALPVVFWNSYVVTIEVFCWDTRWKPWGNLTVYTGAGELVPIRGVEAVGGNHSAIVTWLEQRNGIPDVADYVEIEMCHKVSRHCSSPIRTDFGSKNYTIKSLTAGVDYIAKLSLCKQSKGTTYRSRAVSAGFVTDPPTAREFPPVNDFDVEVKPNGNVVDLLLSYVEPKVPNGADFFGVEINVFDKANFYVVEGLRPRQVKIVIPGLPYYAHFTVKIEALYDDFDEMIRSVAISKVVATGPGVLPAKPQFTEAISISKSSAIIRWSHAAHRSVELSYKIVLNGSVPIDIEELGANFTLIEKGLKPGSLYEVEFTALLAYEGSTEIISEDRKLLQMLPEDALVAKPVVDDIRGEEMILKWNVTLPTGAPKCSISIVHCPSDSACSSTVISDMAEKSAVLEIIPFDRYNITMNTTCSFEPNITVSGVSETRNILAASRPPILLTLSGNSSDENTLDVFWTDAASYTAGYEVSYTVVSVNSWRTFSTTKKTCQISGLESSTKYNVSVVPYSMNETKTLRGPSSSIILETAEKAQPPEVSDLTAKQVPFTRTIELNWRAPLHPKGPLGYRIVTKCPGERTFESNETSFKFEVQDTSLSDCSFTVQSYFLGSGVSDSFSRPKRASVKFENLPPPVGAEEEFVTDGKYRIRITPPELKGAPDFEYEISSGQKFARRYKTTEIDVEEKKFYTKVSYAVRVCVEDFCSAARVVTFVTNTGKPERVQSIKAEIVEVTAIKVTWSKPFHSNGPIDGYLVEITEKSDPSHVERLRRSSSEMSLVYRTDKEYTKYNIAVRAYNYDQRNHTVLKFSNDAIESIETEGTVPRPPRGVSTEVEQGRKIVRWNAETDKKFNITRFKVKATRPLTQEPIVLLIESREFELSKLPEPYTEYDLEISSCIDAVGEKCGAPAELSTKTDVGPPDSPNVQLVERNTTNVVFRWTVPAEPRGPIDGYEYAYAKTADGISQAEWIPRGKENRWGQVKDLEENTAYIFHVVAYNLDVGSNKKKSSVGIMEVTTMAAKGGVSIAAIAISIPLAVAVLAALLFVAFHKFGHIVFPKR